jgi:hypothetical protein
MKPRYFPPSPPSLKGKHKAGSMVQNASIGNKLVVPGQGNQDHPGKARPPLPVDLLRVAGLPRRLSGQREEFNGRNVLKHDTRRIDANDDRKPAPVKNSTLSTLQGDAAAHLPNDSDKSKRPASMHPASEPVPKRAKKQGARRRSYASQNAAYNAFRQPAARKTAPPYQDGAQVKREPTIKIETDPESGQEIKREPAIKIENDPNQATLRQKIEDMAAAHEVTLEELAAATETIEVRDEEIFALVEKAAAVSAELEEAKTGIGIATTSIFNLAISLSKLTAESKLEDACQGHDVVSQGLKANLVALQTQIDALKTQLAPTNPERNNIQSELEASMPGATLHEEFPTDDDLGNDNDDDDDDDAVAPLVECESSHDLTLRRSSRRKIPTSSINTPVHPPTVTMGASTLRRSPRQTPPNEASEARLDGDDDDVDEANMVANLKDERNASVTSGDMSDAEVSMAAADDEDDKDDEDNAFPHFGGLESSVSMSVDRDPSFSGVASASIGGLDPSNDGRNAGKWKPEEDAKLTKAVEKYGKEWGAVAAMVPGRTNDQCRSRWTNILDPINNGRNAGKWKPEEDAKLTKAMKKHGKEWVAVALMVPGRSNNQCRDRWTNILDPSNNGRNAGKWKPEEDGKLTKAVKKHGKEWVAVAAMVTGRTNKQCHDRWTKILDPSDGKNAGKWKPKDDAKLTKAVKKHGKDWVAVAAMVPGRRNDQCQKRWTNILDPSNNGRNAGKWKPQEDGKLTKAVKKHGKEWVAVAAMVPGRTNKQCRNRWITGLDPNRALNTIQEEHSDGNDEAFVSVSV